MNDDVNSPEQIAARKNQEDPIVMYLIVNEILGMGVGKTAAQCGHAVGMLHLKLTDLDKQCEELEKLSNIFGSLSNSEGKEWDLVMPKSFIFHEWLNSSFRKVVLTADLKEWEKLKEEFKDSMVLVVDAGLTEIPEGSETVIGLFPMRKSQRSKLVKRLRVLK